MAAASKLLANTLYYYKGMGLSVVCTSVSQTCAVTYSQGTLFVGFMILISMIRVHTVLYSGYVIAGVYTFDELAKS